MFLVSEERKKRDVFKNIFVQFVSCDKRDIPQEFCLGFSFFVRRVLRLKKNGMEFELKMKYF